MRETTIPRWAIGAILVIITFWGSMALAVDHMALAVSGTIQVLIDGLEE